MKTLLLCACLLAGHGGDREKGLQLYKEGRYAEAAAMFRSAIESDGDSADLEFNLALASWRAGDLASAETAVEKYAAMAADARTELHAGLLGALRYDEAKAFEAKGDALVAGGGGPAAAAPAAEPEDPLPLFEQALQKAVQSQVYFLRGAKARPLPELLRNVERVLRTIDELEKKIDELKKQRKEQKKDDDKKDGEKKPDEKNDKKDDKKGDKKDEKKDDKGEPKSDKPDQKKDPQQQPQGQGEEKPEPKQGEGQEPKPGDDQPQPDKPESQQSKPGDKPPAEPPEPKPGEPAKEPRTDAPGEVAEGKELSPEQTQRLMELLEKLDEKMKTFRARAKTSRRLVERDW